VTDVHTIEQRSKNMRSIRGKNTKIELIVRKYLHQQGFRFLIHDARLPGKPDIVLPKYKTVIFANGCFWHGHDDCKYFVLPKTKTEWWKEKIFKTKELDDKNMKKLIEMGWKVVTIFECELKKEKFQLTMAIVENKIRAI
jgi:DNA mismatch endonuclease (patch repair protein)